MTSTGSSPGHQQVVGSPEPRAELRAAGRSVHLHVTALQAGLRANRSAAVADLARLRRATFAPIGADPAVLAWTIAGLPPPLSASDEPTADELAAHASVTLYATHQQSRSEPMYRWGSGLGRAVARLQGARDAESAVRRRFDALVTADSLDELVRHARGLVTQLRGVGIPLDYARLADQLVDFQDPRRRNNVRLVWGRDFHRRTGKTSSGSGTTADPAAPTDGPDHSEERA